MQTYCHVCLCFVNSPSIWFTHLIVSGTLSPDVGIQWLDYMYTGGYLPRAILVTLGPCTLVAISALINVFFFFFPLAFESWRKLAGWRAGSVIFPSIWSPSLNFTDSDFGSSQEFYNLFYAARMWANPIRKYTKRATHYSESNTRHERSTSATCRNSTETCFRKFRLNERRTSEGRIGRFWLSPLSANKSLTSLWSSNSTAKHGLGDWTSPRPATISRQTWSTIAFRHSPLCLAMSW